MNAHGAGFDHAARAQRALHLARQEGADGLLVTGRTNYRYLSGFTGSNGSLLVLDGETLLVTDGRYVDQAAAEAPDAEVVVDRDTSVAAARAAVGRGLTRLGAEAQHMSVADFHRLQTSVPELALITTSGLVESLRRHKEPGEISLVAHACRITSEALLNVIAGVRPGMSERRIARRLEDLMVAGGADSPAFETIVAAGPNSAIPHHRPTDRIVQAGDLLKIDAGAALRGYRSDMTRTFVVGAEPSARQKDLHDAVAAAAAAARAKLEPGVAAVDLDTAAREALGGLAKSFTHGLGHGVGLDIHETPMVGAHAAATIDVADVLTIEPGVYLAGFGGIRIEDTLAVTPHGADCLTTCPRELVRLG